MQKYSSIEYAEKIAQRLAIKAEGMLLNECDWMIEKRWKQFFLDQTSYLIKRKK